jgi:antitoxin component of MazEF toxin-antitoxin module
MIRKIFKTGHSAAVTLSQSLLKELGLKMGDSVKIEVDGKQEQIVIRHASKSSQMALGFKVRPKL